MQSIETKSFHVKSLGDGPKSYRTLERVEKYMARGFTIHLPDTCTIWIPGPYDIEPLTQMLEKLGYEHRRNGNYLVARLSQ